MDEQKVDQTPSADTQQPLGESQVTGAVVKPDGGNRNLMLAIGALIIGAVIIAGVFVVAFPQQQAEITPVTTSQTKSVTNITKTSDLNAASSELDSTNLDSYQSDLNQIDASAASF